MTGSEGPALQGVVHQASFRFRDDVTAEEVAALREALHGLRAATAGLLLYTFGDDLGLRAGNASFGVLGVFESQEAYQAYAVDPLHQRIIAEHVLPMCTERLAVQYRTL